jgi:hypothetical protein
MAKKIRSGNYVYLRDDWAHVSARTNENIWETLMIDGLLHPAKLFFFFFLLLLFLLFINFQLV